MTQQPERLNLMGLDVIVSNIPNRHVRRAISKRGSFLHYSAEGVRMATGHRDHTDVTRHRDTIAQAYNEASTHTDESPKAEKDRNKTRHLDTSKHEDQTRYDDTDSDSLMSSS